MTNIKFAFAKNRATPLLQFIVSLLMGWLGMTIVHYMHLGPGNEYFGAFIGIIFFCIFNVIVSLAYESFFTYTLPCYAVYAVLVVILLLSAKAISGLSIWGLYEYRMMLTSITLFYLIASTFARGARLIYEAAESGL